MLIGRTTAVVAGEGACCFPDDICLDGIDGVDCKLIAGVYLGDGSTCDGDEDGDGVVGCDDLCPDTPPDTPVDEFGCPSTGACCFADVWVCLDNLDEENCLAIEGIYEGGGSFCSDARACVPAGACAAVQVEASDGESGDAFGGAVAANGNVLLVGSRYACNEQGIESGAVYAYRYNGADWIAETKLVTTEGGTAKQFGGSVALDGDVAVVGAKYDDPNGVTSGSAYIFNFDGADWIQQTKLIPADGDAGDRFGHSVAISEHAAIVGAAMNDDNGSETGSAYVFRFNGDDWTEEAKLLASDKQGGDWFGISVAIGGDVALVGAYLDDDNGSASGSVYVFRFDGASWVEETKLLASDGMEQDHFGVSVAFDGNLALIGAYLADDNGIGSGSAYVFRFDGKDWVEEAKLLASDGMANDSFGQSVAIDGDIAVVGAWGHDDFGSDYGAAYLFRFDATQWVEATKLLASDGSIHAFYGLSVAVSGELAVVGAADNFMGEFPGSAYLYDCALTGCEGDANGDGLVDPLDSGFVLARFGCPVGTGDPSCDTADMNGDGLVDPLDSGFVLARFGDCP